MVVLSPFSQSTPVGGGCTLHVTTFAVPIPGTSNQFGHAIVGLPIPFDASLRGRSLFAQAAALDPNGPLGGLALTGLRTLTFGD